MSVIFSRAYGSFASGASATLDTATEASLVAQGFAAYTAATSVSPNPATPVSGPFTAGTYCPAVISNIPMGGTALTGYETNGVAQTAWNTNVTEIFTPGWNTWTGASYLNGTGVGTDKAMVFLFDTNGKLIANSVAGGTLNAAGASVWEDVAFTSAVTLPPGRYFLGLSLAGATVTPRHVLSVMGAAPRCAVVATITSHAVALATLQAGITVPTSYTTALAPIMRLYS